MKYTYDSLGRVSARVVENGTDAGKLTSTYEYVDGGYGTGSTTPLVKKITQNGVSFEYAYDSRGNIISEKRNGIETTYAYDALGQLIRVNDPHENATWVYNYDRGGNITSKVQYAYVTTSTLGTPVDTISYTYGDSNWKDKLTSFNGQTITYDAIGNPTNDGMWTYAWQAGRQLKRMSREGQALSFKYGHDGLRIEKVLEHSWYPEITKYTYQGKLLTHMNVNYFDCDEVEHNDEMHFFYDTQSRPAKVSFNGNMYTYIYNLQGDIVGILDNIGTLVVEYKYDAWGKLLSVTGNMAAAFGKRNPFRYRGYIYDEESELYNLRSRLYSPVRSRFISSDNVLVQTACFKNLFAYCDNRCVIHYDPSGHSFLSAISNAWNAASNYFKHTVKPFAKKASSSVKKAVTGAWNTAKGAYSKYVVPTAVKTYESGKAILGGFGVDVGAGLGLGGDVNLGIIQAGALYRNDLINFNGTLKEGADVGALYEYSMGVSMGVPGVDALSFGGSMAGTHFHPIGADNCDCGNIFEYVPSCAASEYEFSTDVVWSIGASLYALVGFTVEASFNQSQVHRDLAAIW